MSEHKQKGLVAKHDGMKVTTQRRVVNKMTYKWCGGLMAAISIVIVIGLLLHDAGKNSANKPVNANKVSQNSTAVPTPQQQALSAVLTGNYTQAYAILDSVIAKTTSKPALANLYIQKAGIASQANDYTNSLAFAQKAESLAPSAESAGLEGDAALASGNKTLALQYYKLQLKRMQPVINQDANNRVQAKITALIGGN